MYCLLLLLTYLVPIVVLTTYWRGAFLLNVHVSEWNEIVFKSRQCLSKFFLLILLVKKLKLEVAHGGRGGHFLNMIKSCLSFISCAFYIVLGKIVLFGSLKEFLKKLNFFSQFLWLFLSQVWYKMVCFMRFVLRTEFFYSYCLLTSKCPTIAIIVIHVTKVTRKMGTAKKAETSDVMIDIWNAITVLRNLFTQSYQSCTLFIPINKLKVVTC